MFVLEILVAIDSFKGSLTSLEAGEAIRSGIFAFILTPISKSCRWLMGARVL